MSLSCHHILFQEIVAWSVTKKLAAGGSRAFINGSKKSSYSDRSNTFGTNISIPIFVNLKAISILDLLSLNTFT